MSMRRRGGMNGNMGLETLNAAATAIASLEYRVPQASISRKKWGRCWACSCLGGSTKRIGHEPSRTPPRLLLPFTAPPSSPASYVPSEPTDHSSPTTMSTLSSNNMFSPIFVTGPYNTQLVSPPVFSTGPCTPPPDLTPPSSPEVPFARFLEFRSYDQFVRGKNDKTNGDDYHTNASEEETKGRYWNGKVTLDKL